MANKLALGALLFGLLLMGWLFFSVVRPFLTPLFVAAVIAVLFRPAYERVTLIMNGRKRIAAAFTTVAIFVLLLLPVGGSLVLAGRQLLETGRELAAWHESPENSKLGQFFNRMESTWLGRTANDIKSQLTEEQRQSIDEAVFSAISNAAKELSEKTLSIVANIFGFLVGIVVMALAIYYFFADGERFLAHLEYLSPLQHEDDMAIWREFENVSRSVVLGTVVAGLAQAALAGIGFAVAGVERVWLLAALTWLTSLLPFVGAGAIWITVCFGLVLDEQYVTASLLAVYGAIVVSGSDNLIRAYVIGGDSKLHPLVVLISVLGAIKFMGLWGIFAGPMIAAIFHSLLNLLRQRLPAGEKGVSGES